MLEKTRTISTICFDIDRRELERCPAPGIRTLEIEVRAYAGQSNSALTSFSYRLIGEPTVGGFLDTFSNRSMFPGLSLSENWRRLHTSILGVPYY